MQAIDSEAIEAVGYEPAKQILRISYRNGRIYDYSDVSPEEVDEFMSAPSQGAYANQIIKPKYKCRRVFEVVPASDD